MHQGDKVGCVMRVSCRTSEARVTNAQVRTTHYIYECKIRFFNNYRKIRTRFPPKREKLLHIYSLTSLSFPAQRTVCARAKGGGTCA